MHTAFVMSLPLCATVLLVFSWLVTTIALASHAYFRSLVAVKEMVYCVVCSFVNGMLASGRGGQRTERGHSGIGKKACCIYRKKLDKVVYRHDGDCRGGRCECCDGLNFRLTAVV